MIDHTNDPGDEDDFDISDIGEDVDDEGYEDGDAEEEEDTDGSDEEDGSSESADGHDDGEEDGQEDGEEQEEQGEDDEVGSDTGEEASGELSGEELETVLSREIKIKVDGEERVIPLKEAVDNYQLRRHADRELEKVAEERKSWDSVHRDITGKLQTVKQWAGAMKDPRLIQSALEEAGFDFKAAAIHWVQEENRRDKLTETQRATEDESRRYQRAKEAREQEEHAMKTAAYQRAVESHRVQLSQWIDSGLGASGIDNSVPQSTMNMARKLLSIAIDTELRSTNDGISAERIAELSQGVAKELGPMLKKGKKANGKAAKGSARGKKKPKPPSPVRDGMSSKRKPKTKAERKKIDSEDYFDALGEGADQFDIPDTY